jgi:hypothetical protein
MLGLIHKTLAINSILYLNIICISPVYCQVSFPDSNAIWNINIVSSEGIPTGNMMYGLKGDTLINDTLYHKLYLLADTTLEDENLKEYLGGFRQDSQRVWFKPNQFNTTEFLLYDFSGQLDDTIWHNAGLYIYNNLGHEFFTGGSGVLYSVIVDIYEYHGLKKFVLFSSLPPIEQDEWFEGIGSIYGLFCPILSLVIGGDHYNLACFKQNDTVKYENNMQCNRCFCGGYIGTVGEKKNTDGIVVFPNPADNSLSIEIEKPFNNAGIEIIDEKGSVIYCKELLENPVNVSNISKGIYFIKLKIDGDEIVKKVIIE